jgi:hypothetical protein
MAPGSSGGLHRGRLRPIRNRFSQVAVLMDLARQRLAAAEQSIDRLRPRVVGSECKRRPIWQLNIDGDLIEWSE